MSPTDLAFAMRASIGIMCLGLMVTTAELLSVNRIYARGGLLSREIAVLQYPQLRRFGELRINSDLRLSPFTLLLITRIGAAIVAFVFAIFGAVQPLLLGVLLITTVVLGLLMPFGLDGGHHMNLVLLIGLTIAAAFPTGSWAAYAGIWFVSIQAVLSYVLAGIAKATSASWRKGTAPSGIFSTDVYGNRSVYRWLARRPVRGRLLAWTTIVLECSFAAVPFVGLSIAWPLLVVGLGFHVASAVLMGLNGFLFAFVAAYPLIVIVFA